MNGPPTGFGPNPGLHVDAQGRPYYVNPDGTPNYVSPTVNLGAGYRPATSLAPGMGWNQGSGQQESAADPFLRPALYGLGALATGGLLGAFAGGGAGGDIAGGITDQAISGFGAGTGSVAGGITGAGAAGITGAAAAGGFPWGSVLSPLIGTAGTLIGSKLQSDALSNAANLQAQQAAATLEFQKQQAAQQQANFIAAQNANYAQWAAREKRLAPYRAAGQGAQDTLAGLLNLPHVNIPEPAPPPVFQTTDYTK